MKSTKILVALALLFSATVFAQREGNRGQRANYHQDLSVEQLATLKTKKMTLALDLSKKQQQELMDFNLVQVEYRKAKMAERKAKNNAGERTRPTADERYAMENAKLDHMIAQQQELKKILTEEQFEQWKKIQVHKHARGKKNRQKEGRRG